VAVIERAGGRFCPDASNDGYRNVSALLSKLLSKNGNEGASDQVFVVLSFGHFAFYNLTCSFSYFFSYKRTLNTSNT
jgi:hypothetical protein